MATRSLPTESDLLAAIEWRLNGVAPKTIKSGLQAVAGLLDSAAPIREDDKPVAAILARLSLGNDRRNPWGLLCALLAIHARQRGDTALFWSASIEVVEAYRQARRAPCKKADDLSQLISAHVAEKPDQSPSDLFREFAALAGTGTYACLSEHDPEFGLLLYWSCATDKKEESINQENFVRRVQRIRQQMHTCLSEDGARQQPAYVVLAD